MSPGVAVKGPEGIVLAADSRVTLQAVTSAAESPLLVNFDNATKLLCFNSEAHSHVGAVTYGTAVIGLRTAHSLMPEFEQELPEGRLTVVDYSKRLSDFFSGRWVEAEGKAATPGMQFIVGGYDADAPYGKLFVLSIPDAPTPVERNPSPDFGMAWGGQLEIAARLIHGFDPALPMLLGDELGLSADKVNALFSSVRPHLEFKIPYQVLPLQDCVDLATFLLRTTMSAQALSVGVRGVGGNIDVGVITRTQGLTYVQRKELRGEPGTPRPEVRQLWRSE